MTEGQAHSPADHYRSRLEQLEQEKNVLSDREETIAWVRLVTFAILSIVAWLGFVSERISGWWSMVPIAIFVLLVITHSRIANKRRRIERRADHNRRGLARISREWDPESDGGTRFLEPEHPYAGDLDLFGSASIFSLISVARTRAGESTLASWLLESAERVEIDGRREAARELQARVDLRESVAMLGDDAGVSSVDLDSFQNQNPGGTWSPLLRPVLLALGAANLTTLVGWLVLGWTSIPFAISIAISAGVAYALRVRVAETLDGIEELSGELDVLVEMIEVLEAESFRSPTLRTLQERLADGGASASHAIRRLATIVALLDSRRNQLFLPFALLMFWSTNLAISLDDWKARYGSGIRNWIEAIGLFEALLSLSSFGWEHPEYVDAEIVPGSEAVFEGKELGHPLIAPDRVIRNDVELRTTRLLIVSGSNMSGKSTLLRTVGVNTVLALAGAPVLARSLVLGALRPGASIQVRDSLLEGKSRFYAEILRLRQIVEMSTEEPPLLYLLDEVLHGTNSHDRTIGASAILKALVANGAIGLVTTHDLALAQVADELDGRALNVHFEDHIEENEMIFDYRMRPGVVTRSNALALMRRIGLDV